MGVTVKSKLPRLRRELAGKVQLAIVKVASDIEAEAKIRAPVDTGYLRSSIQAIEQSLGHWRVNVAAEYAAYVEYGTRRMAAQPYLTPAAEIVASRSERIIAAHFGSSLL